MWGMAVTVRGGVCVCVCSLWVVGWVGGGLMVVGVITVGLGLVVVDGGWGLL